MELDASADGILTQLQEVERQRSLRECQPSLATRVEALKHYQQQRFARTYADLLASSRYAQATRFFLQELYGPGDFSRRDAQFARVVPALVRIFPSEVVNTVAKLAHLHALSETLDTRMAQLLGSERLNPLHYAQAWQACGEAESRMRQIALTLDVGASLEQLTRKPLLRQALRMMRGPATAAGLPELQNFLESGFDTFKAMQGAQEFLQTIRQRETLLAQALFAPEALTRLAGKSCPAGDDPLGQLP
ncbi:hypothetical protein HNP55_004068 [Paucibacter oligotrophus]|uniref:DUF8198 domain-containing protein n=1 Tax=Roseateles oligotrophus TaxID=1769250 RepID=A0A840LBI2_9BURK|nr:hypothetical protein [Roseateles oligotrophus]MBB4845516.1 hypothetical protein [Roseateles oligotrophus]